MGHLSILIWIKAHVHSKPNTFNFLGFSNFTIFYQKYVSILFWKGKHYKRYKSICINNMSLFLLLFFGSLVHKESKKYSYFFFWYVVLLIIRNKRKTMCNDILSSITSVVLYVHFCIFQFFHLHTYYFFSMVWNVWASLCFVFIHALIYVLIKQR